MPLPDRHLPEVVARVAGLTHSGLPLASGLRALSAEAPTMGLRWALNLVGVRLERGEPLETVLGARPGAGSPLLNLIRAGERAGRLDLFLSDYLEHRREERRLHWKLLAMFVYPSVLFAIVVFFFTFVVAGFVNSVIRNTLEGYGIDPTLLTRLVLDLSRLILDMRGFITVGFAVYFGVAALALIPYLRGYVLRLGGWFVPPVGEVLLHRATAGFCRILGKLVQHGVVLPDALRMAGGASRLPSLNSSAKQLARVAAAGGDLGEAALYEKPIFLDVAHALRWHREQQMFSRALLSCAEHHERQAMSTQSLWMLERLLRPLFLLFLAIAVLCIYAAILLPLIQLLNKLS